MATRLLLLCHASTGSLARAAFPADGAPLNERGRRMLSQSLSKAEFAAGTPVVSGPEARCAQTAGALEPPAEVDEGLRDCDFGRWTSRTLADVQAAEPDAVYAWLTDPAAAPHGGESVIGLLARVREWLSGLPDGRRIAVTHPSIIRAAVVHALGAPPEAFWRIDVEPLARVGLTGRAGRWNLRYGTGN